MASAANVGARVDAPTPQAGGLLGSLRPAAGLLGRVRWLFAIASVVLVLAFGLAAAAAGLGTGRWPLALIASLGLALLWLDGHRRGRFTLATDLATAVGLI